MDRDVEVSVESWLAHGGLSPDARTGAVVPAIPVSTTFARGGDYALTSDTHEYVRDDDDAVRLVEQAVRRLEGAAGSCVFASGMAAITAVLRSVPTGGTIVVQSGVYFGAVLGVRRLAAHHGVGLVELDTTDTAAATAAIAAAQPDLVLVEVISNPLLGVTDVRAIAEATHAVGGVLAVDATVPTSLSVRPLELGADLSIHSATKSLNGHSDVLAGVVSTADAGSPTWTFLRDERAHGGAVLGPFGAWLLLRGMRTMPLRHDRACATALALATHLEAHPAVVEVLHPGLPSHPGHGLALTQCTRGVGSLFSFRVRGGAAAARSVAGSLRLAVPATSLGGVETLVEHRHTVEGGVTDTPPDLLRISVGIEHADDLVADLDRALATLDDV